MDIAKYAVGPESYNILSQVQIANFFSSNAPTTRDECDDLAAKLLGGSVSATTMQGGSSYTVERDEVSVVQFRSLKLDMAKFGLARQVYRGFVPRCEYHGMLGSLHVYICERVSGPAFCRVRRQMFISDGGADERLRRTGHCGMECMRYSSPMAALHPQSRAPLAPTQNPVRNVMPRATSKALLRPPIGLY